MSIKLIIVQIVFIVVCIFFIKNTSEFLREKKFSKEISYIIPIFFVVCAVYYSNKNKIMWYDHNYVYIKI